VVRSGPPAAPTDLRGEPVSWDNSSIPFRANIRLVWLDRADNETGYRVTETLGGYCPTATGLQSETVVGEFGPNTQEAAVPVIDISGRRCGASVKVVAFNSAGTSAATANYIIQPPKANPPVITEFYKLTDTTYRIVWTHEPAYGGYTTQGFLFTASYPSYQRLGSISYSKNGTTYVGTLTTFPGTPSACGSVAAQNNSYAVGSYYDPTYDGLSSSVCAAAGPPSTLEAEYATRLPGISPPPIATVTPGYTGTGYVGSWGGTGQAVQFTYYSPTTRTYTIGMRYNQSGSAADSTRTVFVNGNQTAFVSFARTAQTWGDPAGWRTITPMSITLNAGVNTIELRHPGPNNDNFLDLDYVTLSPS
jgi:hypothetical protein